ncbi:hypothetical protein TWF718_001672 [Orbilia javanica]|uniref:Uncharacterized protein n=1 Tax=Orbilia javanica TaxID=47235 RepID=A0AAN8RHF2_9PEZI
MPPKRAAPARSRAAPPNPPPNQPSDDSDSGSSHDGDNEQLPVLPRSRRWAKVSCSGNLDDDYKLATRNLARAYRYICLCQAPFTGEGEEGEDDDWEDDDDEDEEDEDEEMDEVEVNANGNRPRRRCDGGRTCLCNKPAADNPNHP